LTGRFESTYIRHESFYATNSRTNHPNRLSFLALAERAVAEGFVRPSHRQAIVVDEDPDRLLDQLGSVAAISESKWMTRPGEVRLKPDTTY
jgi:hypothetical protein